jgi:hypothetical protein
MAPTRGSRRSSSAAALDGIDRRRNGDGFSANDAAFARTDDAATARRRSFA